MKNIVKLVSSLIITIIATCNISAETITFDKGNISFYAPDNFKELSQELIEVKYPRAQRPKFVIGNKKATSTIAYDLKNHLVPQDKIEELKLAFETMFNKMNVKWIKNEIINKSEQKWIYFEFESKAIDTNIINIMLVTGYKNQMLVFNFNSTVKEFSVYEKDFRKGVESLKIIDN